MLSTDFLSASASIGRDPEILRDIHLPAKNIVIYQRDVDSLCNEIEKTMQQPIAFRTSGSTEEIVASLTTFFENQLEVDSCLLSDISAIVELFKDITKASSFRLMLATVHTNMCRKFHTDINDLRLLCTYSGPGTLWLSDDNVNRKALNSPAANESIVLNENLVQQAAAGDVVILKGAIYPQEDTLAAVHRSPTIEESGARRLLLRIDTNEFLNLS